MPLRWESDSSGHVALSIHVQLQSLCCFRRPVPTECPSSVCSRCENRKHSNQLRRPSLSLSTEGCPGLCNSNGRCTLDQNGWHCVCQPGWRGAGCDVAMETLCTDSKDNEGGKRCWAGERAHAWTQVDEFSWVPGYLLPPQKKYFDPHRLDWLKNVWVLIEWFCSLFSLKQMQDYRHSGKRQGNQATV